MTSTTTHPSKSLPSNPRSQSDHWIQHEFAVAKRNAEKNRTIEIPSGALAGNNIPKNRASNVNNKLVDCKRTSSSPLVSFPEKKLESATTHNVAPFQRTVSAPTTNGERTAVHTTIPIESDLVGSIHRIIDEWSTAVQSMFSSSENSTLNKNSRNTHRDKFLLL